jgi:hypothetical protein
VVLTPRGVLRAPRSHRLDMLAAERSSSPQRPPSASPCSSPRWWTMHTQPQQPPRLSPMSRAVSSGSLPFGDAERSSPPLPRASSARCALSRVRDSLASPSNLSASLSELLASPRELLASPSELLASPSELLASPSELLASRSEL